MTPLLHVAGDLLGLEHVVQRVEQRPQVRVDLRHQVAGQEAEPLAGLDRRPREDDAVDLAARERRRGHGDGEERLAGAGGADAEGDRVVADRVDVALLVDRLGRDLARRGGARRRPRAPRAGDSCWSSARVTARIVPGAISWPCSISSESSRTTVAAPATALGLAVERDEVPAQEHVAVEVALERAQHLRPRCPPARPRPRWTARSGAASARSAPPGPRRRDALAVRAPGDLRHRRLHHRAHVLGRRRAALGDGRRPRSPPAPRRTARRAGSPRSSAPRTPPGRRARRGRPRGTRRRTPRRRLRSRRRTASSSSEPSLAAFCSSERMRRSAPTRSRSPAFIAVVRSDFTVSASVMPSRV